MWSRCQKLQKMKSSNTHFKHLQLLLLSLLYFTCVAQENGFLQQTQRPNCFDYTATQFDVDTSNDLGFTTGLTITPGYQCEIDIYTGIARFVFETGVIVQMYGFDSLGNAVLLGRVRNGQIVYWYDFTGESDTRRFVVTNPMGEPLSFRVTIQKLAQLLEKGARSLSVQSCIATLIGMIMIMGLL